MKLLLKISYLGSNYCGWQIQPDRPTVQGEICRVSRTLFGVKCDVTGCSRTDSGVHANEFCATVAEHGKRGLDTDMSPKRITRAMCALLPSDISVYDAASVPDTFHPRYDVVKKEYIYRIYTRTEPSPFEVGRSFHCPFLGNDESLLRMQLAAKHFIGTHDFSAFMAQGSKITDAKRTVFDASVTSDPEDGNIIIFRVSADGFLYNMVRIMAGTLISVGRGRLEPSDISRIIGSAERSEAGETVPPYGLYLNKVTYSENYFQNK